MSNFGRAAAVEISQICCGLAPTAPPILAGHLFDSVDRNSEIRRGAFGLAIPKIPAKWTAAVGLCLDFQCLATVFRGNSESNWRLMFLLLLRFFPWCPWPESNQHSLRNSILSRARLPVPPQGHSRRSRPRRARGREARRTIAGGPSRSTRADVIVLRLDSGIFTRYDPD